MSGHLARRWLAGAALCAAALAAAHLRLAHPAAPAPAPIDLERLIPGQLAGWRLEHAPTPLVVPPELRARIERVYHQTLARTYVNESGDRVMLVIAYGADQSSDALQAHRPEYCYRAQGFAVRAVGDATLALDHGALPVRRLVAERAARREPVTYWLTVGDRAALPGLSRKLAQLRAGLARTVPDGLLVRVSSLEREAAAAHRLQDEFIRALLASTDAPARARLAGSAL